MKTKAQIYFKETIAGELAATAEGDYYFTYVPSYLESKLPAISYSLPKTSKPYFSRDLHGFFDGLLPEGWLMELAGEIYKLNPLADRYQLLLTTCYDPVGAVSVRSKETVTPSSHSASPNLNQQESTKTFGKCLFCYEKLASGLYHEACSMQLAGVSSFPEINLSAEVLREMEKINLLDHVSVPGVQHKVSMDFTGEDKGHRLTVTNYAGQFILKPKAQIPHVPENEHLTLKLAEAFGIETAVSSLVLLDNGDFAFISKRFDRNQSGEKLHVEDFAQILDQLTLKKYVSSIERVGKTLKKYCDGNAPMEQVLRLFELVVFSYVVGNSDLHLKNISVILNPEPQLSPAYDLLSFEIYQEDFKERDSEESALAINGRKSQLRKEDFDSLASALGIKPKVRDYVYKRLLEKEVEFVDIIQKSFLPTGKQRGFIELIQKRTQLFQ